MKEIYFVINVSAPYAEIRQRGQALYHVTNGSHFFR
jgi:hypothetical protein